MQTRFEQITENLFVRHEIYQSVVRSVLAAHPGDLSVSAEIEFVERPCPLCLAKSEHTLRLHHNALQQAAGNG